MKISQKVLAFSGDIEMEHGDARDQRLLRVLMVLTIRASIYCYWKIYFPSGLKEDFLSSDNAKFF